MPLHPLNSLLFWERTRLLISNDLEIPNLLEGEFGCINRCQLQKEADALIVREITKFPISSVM